MNTAPKKDSLLLEDRMLSRHQEVMRERLNRYKDFARFQEDAPSRLPRLYATLAGGSFYRDYYSLCVTPGGAMGGRDPRTLQVFFGARPFDFGPLPAKAGHAKPPFTPSGRSPTIVERGAMLQYSRTDRGEVLLILRPAQTDFTRVRESEILLGAISSRDLESPAVLMRHLTWLLAYMAGTSLDGVSSLAQRWRYWRLSNLHLWRDASTEKWRPSRLFEAVYWLAKWVFTVALSGALLYFIQREWPLPNAVTPAVKRAAAHQDHEATFELLKRVALSSASASRHQIRAH